MKSIPLTQGLAAIVSDEDYERLAGVKWFAQKNHKAYYARRMVTENGKERCVSMHTVVLGDRPDKMVADHINGEGLDNRRENLRWVTHAQNQMNRRDRRGSSLFRGVRATASGRFCAALRTGGKEQRVGTFSTELEAAAAWDKRAREVWGEYAYQNLAVGREGTE